MRLKLVTLLAFAGLFATALSTDGTTTVSSENTRTRPDGRPVPSSALRQAPGGPRFHGPPLDPGGDPVWLAESMIPNNNNRRVSTCGNGGHPMVVATNGVRHVVWYNQSDGYVYYQRYYPATNTWTAETTILGTAFHSYVPVVALDSDGTTIHVVCQDAAPSGTPPPGTHVYYNKCTPSTEGNGGWDTTCVVSSSSNANWGALVACGPNHHVAIGWTEYAPGSFWAVNLREILNGVWQSTVRRDSSPNADSSRGCGGVAVLTNGDVYLLSGRGRMSEPGWGRAWFLRRLGGTWQTPEQVPVDPANNFKWYYCMAVDPTTGYPHVGWCAVPGWGTDGHQVWHNWRDNGGWHVADSISRKKDLTWWMDQPSFAFTPQGVLQCAWSENFDAGHMGVAFREWYGGNWGDQVWVYQSGATNDDNLSFPATDTTGNAYVVTVSCRRRGRDGGFDLWYRDRVTPTLVLDVGVASIVEPSGIIPPGAVTPQAVVHNYGDVEVGFDVTFKINSNPAYEKTVNVPGGVPPGEDMTVDFPNWTATDGYYTAQCSTHLAGDNNPGNDKKTVDFAVALFGWTSRTALPDYPSGKQEGAGGWLAYNAGDRLIYAAKGKNTSDFYAFSPSTNSWTGLAPIQKGRENKLPEDGCRGVTDCVDHVYMTKGNNTLGFWCYTISTGVWTQLADVPAGAQNVKGGTDLAFVVAGGVGYVYLLKGQNCEFDRYNTSSGKWELLPSAPRGTNGNWLAGSWLVYDGSNSLYAHKALSQEMYRYDILAGAWDPTALPGMPLDSRYGGSKVQLGVGGCAAWLDGVIYALKGNNTTQFWKYVPAGAAWSELDTMPQAGTGGQKKNVHVGGDITATNNMLFAFKGNKTNELWRYVRPPEGVFGGGAAAGTELLQTEFALSVSPNPVKLTTAIRYSVPTATNVSLKLYDVTGTLARTVSNGRVKPGRYSASLSTQGLARGVYILKLKSDACNLARKLVIE